MKAVEKRRNSIEFKVSGRYAMFTEPIERVGGEKCSYQIPTYEAIKGIVESIYWKPSIIWYVDAVRVMKRIQTESKGVKTLLFAPESQGKKGVKKNDLSYYTYLRDVEYQVLAHFEFNRNYPNLSDDWNENKHHNIAKRCVAKGGRRDIFLGTRECQGYVEECLFGSGAGDYDDYGQLSFGLQFHGYDYPNETGVEILVKRSWMAQMEDGVIIFPPPKECKDQYRETVRPMKIKPFADKKNFRVIQEEEV